MLFAIDWKFFDDKRSDGATFFASQSLHYVQKIDPGRCRLLGRFHNLSKFTGVCIFEADSVEDAYEWAYHWTEDMCSANLRAIVTDDEAREIVSGKKVDYSAMPGMDALQWECKPGEAIFLVWWELLEQHRTSAYETLATMTQEQSIKDAGNCRPMGRFHDMGNGTGFCLCMAKSTKDVQAWCYNWQAVANFTIDPVITDAAVQRIVRDKPGYAAKLENLKARMKAQGYYDDESSFDPVLEDEHAHRVAQSKPGFHQQGPKLAQMGHAH